MKFEEVGSTVDLCLRCCRRNTSTRNSLTLVLAALLALEHITFSQCRLPGHGLDTAAPPLGWVLSISSHSVSANSAKLLLFRL